jgi:MFS transporter, PPP family, 3-phenylpropionic acid transporter
MPPLAAFVLLYAALYAAFGVFSPFLPALLGAGGLAAEQISFVMAAGTAIRLVSGPLAGRFADRCRAPRAVLAACAAAAAAIVLTYAAARGFAVLALVAVAQAAMLAPLAPVSDAVALSAAASGQGRGFEYGWVRGVGSAAFIAGSLVAGQAVDALGLPVIVWLQAALLATAVIAVAPVPAMTIEAASAADVSAPEGGLRALLVLPRFRRLMLVAALVLGSHAFHDTFAVIQWQSVGIEAGTASLLWSESVAAEVVVFFVIGPPLVRRLGPAGALALAALAGLVRWTVMGATTALPFLAAVEPLHGFTFALLHLAGMRVIAETVPAALANTAQAIYGTVAVGGATVLLTVASGWLYARVGQQGFWAMAMLCAVAIPLARGLRRP